MAETFNPVARLMEYLAPGPRASDAIGPIREASPEDLSAAPSDELVSREQGSWFPAAFLDAVATNDDPILLRNGQGLKLYDALLSDETAFATLQQRRLAITSRDYEVIPGDDGDPRSVQAADDFRAMIDALGFDRVTGLLHYSIWYGYGVGEGLYETRVLDGRTLVWLTDIVVPDRRHFGFTGEGELRFLGDSINVRGEIVPPNKFITIRTGATHDFAFYGLGLAHWCYWPIFFKRAALKYWALYLEKYGAPTVVIEYDPTDDDKAKGKKLAAARAVTRDAAAAVPKGYVTEERMKIMEATRSGGAESYQAFVLEQNDAIARVVLGQPGTIRATPGGLGGDGQARKDEGVKAELVKADSDLISDAIQRFGKWITNWNHGPDVAPPFLRRILDDSEDLSDIADRDAVLYDLGIKRTEDSIKATFGDGYEVDRLTAEQEAENKRNLALADAAKPDAAAEFAARFDEDAEAAIEKLIDRLTEDGSPIFAAMAEPMRAAIAAINMPADPAMQREAIRVALLQAYEELPTERLAMFTALPMLAERAGALAGAEAEVVA